MQQKCGSGLRVWTWGADILKQSMYGIGSFRDNHDKISAGEEVFSRKWRCEKFKTPAWVVTVIVSHLARLYGTV